MDIVMANDFVLAAVEYSLAYMLLGGGLLGAVVIFFAAKAFGK